MPKLMVTSFDHPHSSYSPTNLKRRLGGKGYGLAAMTRLGLPVPEGFTIETSQSLAHQNKNKMKPPLWDAVSARMPSLVTDWGDWIVSVRSGAPVSMPGMMDTILNVGLTVDNVERFAEHTNQHFAYDSLIKLYIAYHSTVNSIDKNWFKRRIDAVKRFTGEQRIPTREMQKLVEVFQTEHPLPEPDEQLHNAIMAVFRSWNSDKAVAYRNIENIPSDMGTAVNVQRMVFGNRNKNSGTGVLFTRNPNTGEKELFGDFLVEGQGEDVVAGSAMTQPVSSIQTWNSNIWDELVELSGRLESLVKYACDVEFTVEDGKLWVLQVREAKLSGEAAVDVALDFYKNGGASKADTKRRIVDATNVNSSTVTDDSFVSLTDDKPVGLAASPGEAVGTIVYPHDVHDLPAGDLILVAEETSPDIVPLMSKCCAVLTNTGGLVSHAAIIARSWGIPAVVGANMDEIDGYFKVGDVTLKTGMRIKVDGSNGKVYVESK